MWSCLQSTNGVFFVNNLACLEENTFNPVFTGKRRIRQQGLIISDLQKLLFGCSWSKTFPSHCFIFKAGGKTEAPRHSPYKPRHGAAQVSSHPDCIGQSSPCHALPSLILPSLSPMLLCLFSILLLYTHKLARTSQ